jgi:hypothetical protein
MTMEKWDRLDYKNWAAKCGALMSWTLNQQYLRERLKFGPSRDTGPVNDMIRHTFNAPWLSSFVLISQNCK